MIRPMIMMGICWKENWREESISKARSGHILTGMSEREKKFTLGSPLTRSLINFSSVSGQPATSTLGLGLVLEMKLIMKISGQAMLLRLSLKSA